MRDQHTYDYAIVRVVPKVEREEFVNAGVIVSCPQVDLLVARIELVEDRLLALDPTVDLECVREHLAAIPKICAGGDDSGPIGRLSPRERFHWLVAPRSTIIQVSAVHSGTARDVNAAVERLLDRMVRGNGGDGSAPPTPPR